MKIAHGRAARLPTDQRGETFTGRVWADPVLPRTDDGVVVNHVFFPPGARTHWHRHEIGQLLIVTYGAGWSLSRDGEGGELRVGDIVWIPAGQDHWHGAAAGTAMSHIAVSHGTTEWLEEVTDLDYEPDKERRA
jgi:quercetin dioxygenase-like cupin family protein